MAQAGVTIDVRITGRRRPLPPGVDLSAYRIVQEALTNVVKHAAPARGTVIVAYGERDICIEVTNDGQRTRPASDGAPGHGLIGMRERVDLYGGQLHVGRPPGGGFQVQARIPITGGQP